MDKNIFSVDAGKIESSFDITPKQAIAVKIAVEKHFTERNIFNMEILVRAVEKQRDLEPKYIISSPIREMQFAQIQEKVCFKGTLRDCLAWLKKSHPYGTGSYRCEDKISHYCRNASLVLSKVI
jgi:hypothetical protein